MSNPKFDKIQTEAIIFNGGKCTVLAAPGCGKTHLLTYRIWYACSQYHIPYSEMLCLTFTNRASREMKDRITEVAKGNAKRILSELFVGNIHRFCINFLYKNKLISSNTTIIDDIDQEDILNDLNNNFEDVDSESFRKLKAWEMNGIIHSAHYNSAKSFGFPDEIKNIYAPVETGFNRLAAQYVEYKQEEQLLDFEDVLQLTYKALCEHDYREKYVMSSYKWIQIDEVQDLNPLQLAIVEKLWNNETPESSIVYFGDERQAIFAFTGARIESLKKMVEQSDKVIHLRYNYRSPKYILDILNAFAKEQLKIDNDKLPIAVLDTEQPENALVEAPCNSYDEQIELLSSFALMNLNRGTSVILVRANKDVEIASESLRKNNIPHMKLSRKDMFKGISYKTLLSHFYVAINETNYKEWIQLLYRTKSLKTLSLSRRFIRKVKSLYLTPHDLMVYDKSSYVIEFDNSFRNNEIVIFDTETTGLNVYENDIIQIAAIKIRNGHLVPGSEFDIIIETDQTIPQYFSDGTLNPMLNEYQTRPHVDPQTAFSNFLEYIGDAELLGHNISFDISMLRNNILRRTTQLKFRTPQTWDTLKLSHLLNPSLRSHKLKSLLEFYDLEGVNSHNAMDDIIATFNVAKQFKSLIAPKLSEQLQFLNHDSVIKVKEKLRDNYLHLYYHTQNMISNDEISLENSFVNEFKYIYEQFTEHKFIDEIPLIKYMIMLFEKVVFNHVDNLTFEQQLKGYIYDLRTFNEADLFQNGIVSDQLFIMTIHKGKGLEFNNVCLFNLTDGVFPHFRADGDEVKNDAKLVYVALSRAKDRIFYTYTPDKSRYILHFDKYFKSLTSNHIKVLSGMNKQHQLNNE